MWIYVVCKKCLYVRPYVQVPKRFWRAISQESIGGSRWNVAEICMSTQTRHFLRIESNLTLLFMIYIVSFFKFLLNLSKIEWTSDFLWLICVIICFTFSRLFLIWHALSQEQIDGSSWDLADISLDLLRLLLISVKIEFRLRFWFFISDFCFSIFGWFFCFCHAISRK